VRVPVVGLVGRPGQRKDLVADVAPEEFGDEPWGPTVEALDGPIGLDLVLESVTGGVLVRGTLCATALGACARCLIPITHAWQVDVLELHRAAPGRDEEELEDADEDLDYALVDGDAKLELDQMVRDALVVGRPLRTLCRPDCAGLCPSCGADRNVEPCTCDDERPADPRWDALRGLRLPPAPGVGADGA
jgi:uncharacterized protein